ncbi:LamG-like jellyroll fold domain-containing protein [Thermodesulfobacteriota bacterium]
MKCFIKSNHKRIDTMKINPIVIFLVGLAVLFSATPALAADGDLDITFGSNGKVITDIGSGYDTANGIALQSDGKIVVAGTWFNGLDDDFAVARYNADGSLDTTFGSGGKVITAIGSSDAANDVAVQSDGKIVVAGSAFTGSKWDFAVVRYNTDGSLDTTFGSGGTVTTAIGLGIDYAYGMAVQSDGKIVVAGESSGVFAVVRYNTDGSLDTTFDTDGKVTTAVGSDVDYAYDVAVQSDGKIVVAGITDNGSNIDFAVVRYNTIGSPDDSFGSGGIVTTTIGSYDDNAMSTVVQSDGKIVVAGYADDGTGYYDFAVVRYNADGSLDTTFDMDGIVTTDIASSFDQAMDLALQSDGKLVAAGYADTGPNDDFAVVRYNTDGSLDSTFGSVGKVTTAFGSYDDSGYGVAVQDDGKIVVAGYSNSGADMDFAVVRYQNNDPSLMAHYPFDGNANDASTQGNNPTAVNATLTTDRRGNTDTAYDFNGVDNSIIVPDSSSLDITNAITLAAWIRPRQANGSYVVQKPADAGGAVYSLDIYPGTVRAVLDVPQVNGTSAIQANQWQHIAMTYDGTTVTVYYNGVAENSTAYAGPIPTSNGDLEIGLYSGGGATSLFRRCY